MTTKEVYARGVELRVEVGEGVKSGDPVLLGTGKVPGIALTDAGSDKKATVKFEGVHSIVVYGWKKEGKEEELELKPFDPVYIKETGKPLSGQSSNTLFGYVLDTVAKKEEKAKRVLLARV